MQGAGIAVDAQDGSGYVSPAFCRMTSRQACSPLGLSVGMIHVPSILGTLCRGMCTAVFFGAGRKRKWVRKASTIGGVVAGKLVAHDLSMEGDGVMGKVQGEVLPT